MHTTDEFRTTLLDFVRVEIETGTTFAEIALGTDDIEKRERERENAMKAYETALKFLADAHTKFGVHEAPEGFTKGLQNLKTKLDTLAA